jgi:hypothetical protein
LSRALRFYVYAVTINFLSSGRREMLSFLKERKIETERVLLLQNDKK